MPQSSFPAFRVLFSNDAILRRTHELVRCIEHDLRVAGAKEPPCLVAVIEGARPFARQVQKLLAGNLPVYEVRASSYGTGTVSSGKVALSGGAEIPARGRHVLLLEDIVDTGRTIKALQEHFLGQGALSCRAATMLSKPSRRVVQVPLDYVGFEIPDEFVIGFGMDLDGRYRELPDVVVYEQEVERAFQQAVAQ